MADNDCRLPSIEDPLGGGADEILERVGQVVCSDLHAISPRTVLLFDPVTCNYPSRDRNVYVSPRTIE